MKHIITLLLFIIATSSVFGQDAKHDRTYSASFDRTWAACIRAASEKYTVTHSEKGSGVITFHQGASFMTNTWGMDAGVTVIAVEPNQTEVILHTQSTSLQTPLSWAPSAMTKKFFKAVEQDLAKQ